MDTHPTAARTDRDAAEAESRARVVAGLSPMVRRIHELQQRWGWGVQSLLVTTISVLSSLMVTAIVLRFVDFDERHYWTTMMIAAIVPALVAPPINHVFTLVTEHLFDLEQRLQYQATYDALTGVPNRHAIMQCFLLAVKAPPEPEGGIGVIMIDVDNFKSINDTHGHDTGDRVLKAVAQSLARALRKTDRLGRYGGEEFLVLTPENSLDGLRSTAERLRAALASMSGVSIAPSGPVTASVGCAIHRGTGDEAAMNRTLRRADEALYRAKRLGRDRVEVAVDAPAGAATGNG